LIEVSGLTVRLGDVDVVADVGFQVPDHGGLALWGTNGAGKTTILRAMLGLVPYSGEITVGGYDARRMGREARGLVGHVPQQLAFWDDMSALECVAFIARLRGAPVAGAHGLLERVGLASEAGKRVRSLSGGMKQRMALAVAMVGDPPILMLDEPTASLDAAGRVAFLALLADLRAAGKTLIVTSHRLAEVQALADRAVVLEAGRVVLECEASELKLALYPHSTMHLVVARDVETAAVSTLTQQGFDARANRRGIVVRVPATDRASPVAALIHAGFAIQDIDLESDA
jgi:ABC-type multidrug transport system ATPase subunit